MSAGLVVARKMVRLRPGEPRPEPGDQRMQPNPHRAAPPPGWRWEFDAELHARAHVATAVWNDPEAAPRRQM